MKKWSPEIEIKKTEINMFKILRRETATDISLSD
jgi:hypothetical protein